MAGIDKGAEIVGRAKARGRREQRDRLIAPRAVERVFGDRHHLDMGEAEIGDIGHELVGQLAIGQIAAAFGQVAAPRAEMHLVDRDRRLAVVAPPALGHPGRRPATHARDGAATTEAVRGGGSVRFGMRVGLQRQQRAVGAEQLVFVERAGAEPGHEDLPEPAGVALPHRHAPAVPAVEIADHADPARVRRPHRKGDARRPRHARSGGRRASDSWRGGCPRRADGGRVRRAPAETGRCRRTRASPPPQRARRR